MTFRGNTREAWMLNAAIGPAAFLPLGLIRHDWLIIVTVVATEIVPCVCLYAHFARQRRARRGVRS